MKEYLKITLDELKPLFDKPDYQHHVEPSRHPSEFFVEKAWYDKVNDVSIYQKYIELEEEEEKQFVEEAKRLIPIGHEALLPSVDSENSVVVIAYIGDYPEDVQITKVIHNENDSIVLEGDENRYGIETGEFYHSQVEGGHLHYITEALSAATIRKY